MVKSIVINLINDVVSELINRNFDEFVEEFNYKNLIKYNEFTFYQTLLDSVEYCFLSRLGINDNDLKFEDISELNNIQLTIALGRLSTEISRDLLSEINSEIELINERVLNYEREQQYNLQRREIWSNSIELLRREGYNKIRYSSDDRGASSNIEETKSRRRELIMEKLLQGSLKIENPENTMAAWKKRVQARDIAEEIVLKEIV